MIVGTSEAAKILNISTPRLRVLLIEGRVEGAYKTGKIWLIPLFGGKPIIQRAVDPGRVSRPRERAPRQEKEALLPVGVIPESQLRQ